MSGPRAKIFQVIIGLIGLTALVFLLGEPHVEGRNAHATFFEIYFHDPFLAYAYLGSVPFFIALRQAFKLAGAAGRGEWVSPGSIRALRTIKVCAILLVAFVAGGEIFILMNMSDDRAGGVFIGLLIAIGSAVMAAVAVMLERGLKGRQAL